MAADDLLKKVSVPTTAGAVVVSVFEDGRVRVSMPGVWELSSMSSGKMRRNAEFAPRTPIPTPQAVEVARKQRRAAAESMIAQRLAADRKGLSVVPD